MKLTRILFIVHYIILFSLFLGITQPSTAQDAPQQPASKSTIPSVDPETVTRDQIKKIMDSKSNSDTPDGDTDNTDGRDSDSKNSKKNGKQLAEESLIKKDDSINNAKGLGLPIFGNEIFGSGQNFAPNENVPLPPNYILGPGDNLRINVTGNSVTNFNATIAPDGSITLREFGKVYIGGKTLENGIKAIKDRLRANNFAVDHGTDVDVMIINIRSIKVNILGQVNRPGVYSLPSTATVNNALYSSGGITPNGSYRNIKVIRNNTIIREIDLYQYLLRGDLSDNINLQDGDIIQVSEYRVRVSIEGEIKRPAYFEILPGETLIDVIQVFGAGFTDYAYKYSIKAIQLTDKEQRLKDILSSEFESYIPLKGDKYTVSRIYDKYENRVSIGGSVYRPGDYELSDGLTLKTLLSKADGLKEDAYLERGYIARQKEDKSTQIIPFYVKGIIDGTSEDILLNKEDVITISSLFDYVNSFTVSIAGKVRKPSTFPYNNGMTIEDLILKGGGFADGANMYEVEIARRIKDSDKRVKNAKLADIFKIKIDPSLRLAESKFKLEPFDVITVYALPGYVQPQLVTIEGEVMYPGIYAMINKDDRISDIINRAQGFTAYAYLKGASLKRGDYATTQTDAEIENIKMQTFSEKQADATDGQRSLDFSATKRNNFVGINLERILKSPRSKEDLILLNGDVINIPRQLQTVKISGEIYVPTTVVFDNDMSLLEYVARSGGYTDNALLRKSHVVYANGSSKGTKSFVFFKNYPKIEPGAEIFIPRKKEAKPINVGGTLQSWIGVTTSLATVAALIITVISANK
jgi:protein involved in polysaccharide export with SLBB domain